MKELLSMKPAKLVRFKKVICDDVQKTCQH